MLCCDNQNDYPWFVTKPVRSFPENGGLFLFLIYTTFFPKKKGSYGTLFFWEIIFLFFCEFK